MARKPRQLSGGQRQRVAIGRAIVRNPQVFLFDEPLSNLDAELRVATRVEIAKLHKQLGGATMVYVTHDQVEAMTLADKIVVLRAGRVEQVGAPMELYHEPANLFAAEIAKYFSNPIREDTILRLSRGGLVFAAGRAGTVQEVFQAATKAFYVTDGASGPFIFLGRQFWGGDLPAPRLLRTLLAATPGGDRSGLVHVTDSVDEALALLTS